MESEDVLHEIPRAPIEKTDEPTGPPMARRVILQKSYFERFGYSANCPKCRAMLRGKEDCHGHTANCRKRIEEAMATDSILKQRLDAAQQRRDKIRADEMERGASAGSKKRDD